MKNLISDREIYQIYKGEIGLNFRTFKQYLGAKRGIWAKFPPYKSPEIRMRSRARVASFFVKFFTQKF